MDDFIDKVAWGLNLVFSNGVGYPKTHWLVFGGAKDELAFKDFLRVHQVPTHVWYSAYGDLTALNIAQNERIRAGLCAAATSGSGCSRCDARARRRPGALRPRLRRPEVGGVPAAEGRGRGRRAALARRGERDDGRGPPAGAAPLNVAFTSSGLERLGLPADAAGEVLERVRRRDDDTAPDADPRRRRRERAGAVGLGRPGRARRRGAAPLREGRRGPRGARADAAGVLARQAARHRRPRRLRAVRLPRRDLAAVRRRARQDRPARGDRPRRRVPARLHERVRPDDRRAPAPQRQLPRLPPAEPGRRRLLAVRRRSHAPPRRERATRTRACGSRRRWSAAGRAAPRSRSRRTRTIRASPTRTTSPTTRTTPAACAARSARTSAARTRATRSTRIPAATGRSRSTGATGSCGAAASTGRRCRSSRRWPAPDSAERGLHFICLNANIARQFEFVNHTWLNNTKFGELYDDADPFFAPGCFTIPTDGVRERVIDVPRFVFVKGGAYFFLPGLAALRSLAAG